MADNTIRLPSGSGGLVRYFDEFKSKIEISPEAFMIITGIIIIVYLFLYFLITKKTIIVG